MNAWSAVPGWEIALCVAILAALITGAVGIYHDIKADLRETP